MSKSRAAMEFKNVRFLQRITKSHDHNSHGTKTCTDTKYNTFFLYTNTNAPFL